jgi:hypothetical protein
MDDEILSRVYEEAFDAMYNAMMYRKKHEPGFTKQSLKELLCSMYQNEGDNWIGRGEAVQLKLHAGVAACEAVLHEWEE